ncbi:MAG: 23S rRNA (guanosine(2251)-2'-O)-methyltransferase RlmB [Candidatus Solincola sediminis]|uniref:23S rRNA (Guanosine(2251)-2'-O)-methyltransferase RlmB n=1 Tax=Candidatus Solincola sediminis TaxID=1797199 RepID=A0A1F2WF87_9ACTN|nr:MAG: 23S rRNA (guanosine(2251)-2'-O)-methyltransferase RlmB [Candidatus Solincola sediminis]OFW57799.1 MAG: 23S rRNA (guanosine(2251)-2'-O)-methyltransferase RlmB [Candidatus Solincola sediminis]
MRFEQVEGKRAVLETLRGKRSVAELLVGEGIKSGGALDEILAVAREKKIQVTFLPRRELERLARSENNQGVIVRVEPYRYSTVKQVYESLEGQEKAFVVLLDSVTDPRNLGSIARTCEAAGVDALLLPRSRAAPVTPAVFHASAGAVENLAIATVPNLVSVMRELKQLGLWVVGADIEAQTSYFEAELTGPFALVMGSEGEGLHRLVRETCDLMVNIPMYGKVGSLNVSVAAGIIIYEAMRQRKGNEGSSR